MATSKWATPESVENIFVSTELDSLGSGSNKITTSALSNDGVNEKFMYADFTLYLAEQASARSAGARVDLYILPASDGTNYPYGGDSLDPASNHWVASFLFDAAVTARYTTVRGVLLPPFNFHVLVVNETGQALASSGNTLKYTRYNIEST